MYSEFNSKIESAHRLALISDAIYKVKIRIIQFSTYTITKLIAPNELEIKLHTFVVS